MSYQSPEESAAAGSPAPRRAKLRMLLKLVLGIGLLMCSMALFVWKQVQPRSVMEHAVIVAIQDNATGACTAFDDPGTKRLPNLTSYFEPVPCNVTQTPSNSPDGKYVAYASGQDELTVATAQGTVIRKWTGESWEPPLGLWSPDSRYVYQFSDDSDNCRRVLVHDMQNLTVTKTITTGASAQALHLARAILPGERVLCMTADDPGDIAGPQTYSISIRTIDLNRLNHVPEPVTLKFDWTIDLRYVVSPDGSRIAWVRSHQPHDKLRDLIYHWLQRSTLTDTIGELLVSRSDGSDLHAIGEVPLTDDGMNRLLPVHWFPDSKRLSIARNGSLYVFTPE